MLSGQPISREDALKQFAQFVQQFKSALPAVIQDKTLNKDGEYDKRKGNKTPLIDSIGIDCF